MRLRNPGLGLLCLTLGTACAGTLPPLQSPMADLSTLEIPKASDYKKADSVVLFRDLHGQLESNYGRKADESRWLHHDATLILTEAGLSKADYRISAPKKAKIRDIKARTITPDGEVHWLDPKQVHADEGKGSQEDTEYTVKVFAFPKAAVGSVLEVQYRIDYPWIPSLYSRNVAGKSPIQHYRVHIEGPEDVYYKVMSYNARDAAPWEVKKSRGLWSLRWEMSNVKASKKGAYLPAYRDREPHWAFSVQAYVKNGQVYHRNSTWDSTVQLRAKKMYHDNADYYKGFSAAADIRHCEVNDLRCKVQAAQAWVTKNLPMRGFKSWPGRDAKEVMNSGEASDIEKSRILYRLLKDLKIEARFALFHGYLQSSVDESFPQLESMDSLALLVKKQGNLIADLWIDPACEYCGLGEVPHWLQKTQALVVDYDFEGMATKPKYRAEFRPVSGDIRGPGQYVRKYEIALKGSGDAHVTTTMRSVGRDAQAVRRRLRTRKPKDWRDKAEEFAKSHFTQAQVLRHDAPKFDPEAWSGTRVVELQAKALGVRDGETLVVPLSFFGWSFDDKLKSKKRSGPIVMTYPYDLEEVATLIAPPGWQVKSTPTATRRDGPFQVTVQASSDGRSVTIKRTLRTSCGDYPEERYAQARGALELFRSLRDQAVTFEAEPSSAPGSAAR